jgi:hypothetical protein
MELAGTLRARGDIVEADRLEGAAIEQALAIVDPVERAAARAELMIRGVGTDVWSDIVADALALDEPWQRARSLASLAAIAVRLAGQGDQPAP